MRSEKDMLEWITGIFSERLTGAEKEDRVDKLHAAVKLGIFGKAAISAAMGAVTVEPGEPLPAMNGVDLIREERRRQVEVEGWDAKHDAEHNLGELSLAALCYASPSVHSIREHTPPLSWPWDEAWWKPGDRIDDLKKAGALCAAEIDRLLAIEVKLDQQADAESQGVHFTGHNMLDPGDEPLAGAPWDE